MIQRRNGPANGLASDVTGPCQTASQWFAAGNVALTLFTQCFKSLNANRIIFGNPLI
jgi:hypothetical protein